MDPCLPGFGQFLVVFAQPPAAAQPSQGALHHPPSGQHLEAAAVRVPAHRIQRPTSGGPSPRRQPASVGRIGPDDLEPGKPVQQLYQDQLGPIPVPVSWHGAGSGCWPHGPPRPEAGPWCPLCPLCPLRCGACARIPSCRRRSPEAPLFRGLDALAVDDGSAGDGIPSFFLPDLAAQRLLNPLPSAIGPPFSEIPPHRAPGRQVMGHHSPWYAAAQDI